MLNPNDKFFFCLMLLDMPLLNVNGDRGGCSLILYMLRCAGLKSFAPESTVMCVTRSCSRALKRILKSFAFFFP